MEALTDHLDWRLPQTQDLQQAIAEADQGDFASDAGVAGVFARYTKAVTAAPRPAAGTARPSRSTRSAATPTPANGCCTATTW